MLKLRFVFFVMSFVMTSLAQIPEDVNIQQICFSSQSSCRECITAHPACSWCSDNQTTPGTQQTRCKTAAENAVQCIPGYIEDFRSETTSTTNNPFDENIQLRPQALNVKLRIGEPTKVNITFRRVVDYPLDLYYVMDLSYSMRDDLQILQDLGARLVENIRANVTENVQLGFGTFVDKVLMPFASTVPEQLQDPCSQSSNGSCAPVFGFRHQVSITPEGQDFIDAVRNTEISGNIDSPEGGFDALMQIAVCQDIIAWRPDSLRVILFTSDASPHIALDGKLAAILEANDMQCHLERGANPYLPADAMVYAKSKLLDYPSIGQLKKVFNDYKIQLVLAVTGEVYDLYRDIPTILDNSFVGELESDSSNVVSVIATSYDALKSQIQLTRPITPSNVDVQFRVLCPGDITFTENSLECTNVSLNQEATFQFEFTAQACPSTSSSNDLVTITSSSLRDQISVTLEYICDCDCSAMQLSNSSSCSNRGSLECGICSCDEGRLGLQCQCIDSLSEIPLEQNCTQNILEENGELCNSKGFCECGTCQCQTNYYGQFCECRRTGCPADGELICGGSARGRCENCNEDGNCICFNGWYLDEFGLCNCNNDTCRSAPGEEICSGNGDCNCDTCVCDENSRVWAGRYCNQCVNPECKGIDAQCLGSEIRTCAECIYEQQRLNQDTSVECRSVCQDVGLPYFQSVDTLPDCSGCVNAAQSELCQTCANFEVDVFTPLDCRSRLTSNECEARYLVVFLRDLKEYFIYVKNFDQDEDCPQPIDIALIVGPVVGGIVLIGLLALIAWKIFQTLRDKREYESFVEEAKKSRWTEGQNPLFSKPEVRIENPMFIDG